MDDKNLKTEYEYIEFEKIFSKGKTNVWVCRNKKSGAWLAKIKWYPAWRQYCFYPEPLTVFNKKCLQDINNFIGQLMIIWRNK